MTAHASDDPLDILAFFHYAIAALMAMLSLLPALYLFVHSELSHPEIDPEMRAAAAAQLESYSLGFVALVMIAGFVGGSIVAWGGRQMQTRRGWLGCRNAALVACLFVPLGTILGAVTLTVLHRPGVRASFQ